MSSCCISWWCILIFWALTLHILLSVFYIQALLTQWLLFHPGHPSWLVCPFDSRARNFLHLVVCGAGDFAGTRQRNGSFGAQAEPALWWQSKVLSAGWLPCNKTLPDERCLWLRGCWRGQPEPVPCCLGLQQPGCVWRSDIKRAPGLLWSLQLGSCPKSGGDLEFLPEMYSLHPCLTASRPGSRVASGLYKPAARWWGTLSVSSSPHPCLARALSLLTLQPLFACPGLSWSELSPAAWISLRDLGGGINISFQRLLLSETTCQTKT